MLMAIPPRAAHILPKSLVTKGYLEDDFGVGAR